MSYSVVSILQYSLIGGQTSRNCKLNRGRICPFRLRFHSWNRLWPQGIPSIPFVVTNRKPKGDIEMWKKAIMTTGSVIIDVKIAIMTVGSVIANVYKPTGPRTITVEVTPWVIKHLWQVYFFNYWLWGPYSNWRGGNGTGTLRKSVINPEAQGLNPVIVTSLTISLAQNVEGM